MIIIRIVGGLASQLNKYALGRALALRHGTELKLDLDWFDHPSSRDTPWPYHLDKFEIVAGIASLDEIHRIRGNNLYNRAARRINRLVGRSLIKTRMIDIGSLTPERWAALPDNVYLYGETCGDLLFRPIRRRLREEFRLRGELSAAAERYVEAIDATVFPVSLHVRRGDFVSNPHAAQFHALTDTEYFREAAAVVLRVHPAARFFVFSDDAAWVAEHLLPRLPAGTRLVDSLACEEDFTLMSRCRGNIICNSGFGWTAAWLNEALDRIVVAPKRWLKDDALNDAMMRSMHQADWTYL